MTLPSARLDKPWEYNNHPHPPPASPGFPSPWLHNLPKYLLHETRSCVTWFLFLVFFDREASQVSQLRRDYNHRLNLQYWSRFLEPSLLPDSFTLHSSPEKQPSRPDLPAINSIELERQLPKTTTQDKSPLYHSHFSYINVQWFIATTLIASLQVNLASLTSAIPDHIGLRHTKHWILVSESFQRT